MLKSRRKRSRRGSSGGGDGEGNSGKHAGQVENWAARRPKSPVRPPRSPKSSPNAEHSASGLFCRSVSSEREGERSTRPSAFPQQSAPILPRARVSQYQTILYFLYASSVFRDIFQITFFRGKDFLRAVSLSEVILFPSGTAEYNQHYFPASELRELPEIPHSGLVDSRVK